MDATSVPVSQLKLEYLSIDALHPDSKNPRKHSKEQIKALARAMKAFDFTNPVLADKAGILIAGHCRLLAAKELGITSIPVIRLEHLTPAQVKVKASFVLLAFPAISPTILRSASIAALRGAVL